MIFQYVTKLYKQHTTLVTSVPKGVIEELGLKRGDHLFWEIDMNTGYVQLCKVVRRDVVNERNQGNPDQEDQGGRV